MAGRSNKPVQTPGQAAPVQQEPAPENVTGEAIAVDENSLAGAMGHPDAVSVGGDVLGDTVGGDETVTISKDSLNLLLARVEALEGAAQNKLAKGAGVVKQRLPDQDDVDPKKITQPQLTEQGWVLPHNFGANPNGNKI